MTLSKRRLFIAALVLLASGLTINSIRQTLPPSVVVIETGPVGGSYHDSAQRYARKLQAAGLKTEIRANPQSMQIINNVGKDSPRVDIGFTVQALDRTAYPHVASLGVVELQPLFIFYNAGLGKIESLVNLRGKRLVMPPENSATSETVRLVLNLYDITEKNTRFTYLPITNALQELKKGQHDAGFFMLAPANQIVRDLINVETLSLLSIPESVGVSRLLDHLRPGLVPLGAYDLRRRLPDKDIAVVSGSVNVIVRKDINPAVLYALLDAMKDVHQGQTVVSSKGEFPTTVGAALEIHPLAVKWVRSGTPWIFTTFGPVFGSLIDKYWLIALALLLLTEVYRTLRYFYEFMALGATTTALRILNFLDRRLSSGRAMGPVSLKLFEMAEKIISQRSQNTKAQALLERLRPAIKP